MTFSQCFSVFTILGALTLSVPAWADVPPADACSASSVGQACPNALIPMTQGTGTAAGVCQAAKCTRATPDGPMTYQCYRCMPSDDGGGGQGGAEADGGGANNTSGGTPSSGSGGASAGGISSAGATANAAGTKSSSSADATNSKSGSDDGGCSLSHARGGGALWAGLIALGLTFAGIRRRRSLTS